MVSLIFGTGITIHQRVEWSKVGMFPLTAEPHVRLQSYLVISNFSSMAKNQKSVDDYSNSQRRTSITEVMKSFVQAGVIMSLLCSEEVVNVRTIS